MNVLITGGAGYIGYSLVRQLLEYNDEVHSVTLYDNLSRKNYSIFTEAKFHHKPVKLKEGDILDGRFLSQALKGIDCVVHLAAKVTTPYADHEAHMFDQVNHWGTAQLTTAIEQSDVRRVIYLSSMSVYGTSPEPIDEQVEPNPHSFYGISKLDGEKQIETLQSRCELYTLRSGNVYGYNPAYRIDAVINRFMFNANFLGRIQINGSGDQYRSFIHVDKLAKCIVECINGNLEAGLYNAVEHNYSINAIAEAIRTLYPSLENIHVNYNLKLRDVRAKLPCKIFDHIELQKISLVDELKSFKKEFSF